MLFILWFCNRDVNIVMFAEEFKKRKKRHVGTSKTGVKHQYVGSKTFARLRCDCCNTGLLNHGNRDPKGLSNNYFHVCED